MKRNIKPFIMPVVLLIVSALLLGTATFAWLNYNAYAKNMEFKMVRINSEVLVYSGVDSNKNGIPDPNGAPYNTVSYLDDNNIRVSYDLYYEEGYDFDYINREYAMAASSTSTKINATAGNMFPSQLKTYKFIAVNKSQRENLISFTFGDRNDLDGVSYGTAGGENAMLLSMLYARTGRINADGTVSFGDYVYFADSLTRSGEGYTLSAVTVSQDLSIGAMVGRDVGRADFWLQIGIAPYEQLAARPSAVSLGMTEDVYHSMQGKSLTLPMMYMHFDLEIG